MILKLFLAAIPTLFDWHGHVSKVAINTVNGTVTVTRSVDDEVHVTAQGVNSEAMEHVRAVRDGGGIVICEFYRSAASPGARCPGSGAMLGIPDRPQRVDFTVSLPKGVDEIRITTVNGAVSASLGTSSRIDTVNGDIHAGTDAPARLVTVNGAVVLTMTTQRWREPASVTSTNGDVTVDLAADADTTIDAESLSRMFRPDRQSQRHLVLGHGRSLLTIQTTSGRLVIREGANVIAQTE
jgi:DUF4097 and DUF4098 domain-containing protein YvlB